MSELGIKLAGAAMLLTGAAYAPRPAYAGYKPKTYALSDGAEIAAALGTDLWPGERLRQPLDRMTNLDSVVKLAWLAQVGVAGTTDCSTAGVSSTFTANATFVAPCTGTLTAQAWGQGGAAGPDTGGSGGTDRGGGGGAFASSAITVTQGNTYSVLVGPAAIYGNYANGLSSMFCTASDTHCTDAGGVTVATCPAITKGICAQGAQSGAASGTGGTSASSIGTTKFNGGSGVAGAFNTRGGGGGGSAGPDGVGISGGAGSSNTGGAGGNGDNNSGGAGGPGGASTNGSPGTSNVKGGGGGGGAGNSILSNYSGSGGNPGGGMGATEKFKSGVVPGHGQVIVHSDASDVLTPVLIGGSGYGGGTVSMA